MKPDHISNTSNLRFGILCNGTSFQKWQADSIRLLIENNIQPTLLIVDSRKTKPKSVLNYFKTYPYTKAFYRIYHRYFLKPQARKIEDLNNILSDIPILNCNPETKGFSEFFQHDDIDKIKSHNLDFILRFGYNIIRGDILNAAKYGIWSFHHDDEKIYRGGPPGFWEIYHNNNVNGVILQKLTNKLDGGIILKKAYYKTTKHSYKENLHNVLSKSAIFPLQVCKDILNNTFNEPENKIDTDSRVKIYHVPGNFKMIWFLIKLFIHKIAFHFNNLCKTEKWNIGIVKMSTEDLLNEDSDIKPIWYKSPPKHIYYADPFAIEKDHTVELYFEEFNYIHHKGKISKTSFNKNTSDFSDVYPFMEKEIHLAYPYIFKTQDTTYLIPETANAKSVELYKLIDGEAVFHKKILDDIDAVDSTLFKYENKWWLFFTKKEDSATELYTYYSEQVDGNYLPHQNNPIKIDVRSARPAGNIFEYNNSLYRPSQDCSKTYGGRIAINKIIVLSATNFKEETVKYIHPFKNTSFNKGVHTISITDNYLIFDAKKYVFDFRNFLSQLKLKCARLIKS